MSLHAWLDYNARTKTQPPSDFVEMDPVLVLEGDAAEDSIRRFLSAQERAPLELLP